MVDSVPPDKGCEGLDRELTHEKWDENEGENFANIDDYLYFAEMDHYKML